MLGLAESHSMATRENLGNVCLNRSRRLPSSSDLSVLNPVMFPPGRARLVTSPLLSGSPGGRHDDRDRLRRSFGGKGTGRTRCHDDVDLEPDQLGRNLREAIFVPLRPAVLDGDALALDVAEVAESLAERLEDLGLQRRRGGAEVPEARQSPRLLRPSDQRRGEEAPGHGTEECSPLHYSIT